MKIARFASLLGLLILLGPVAGCVMVPAPVAVYEPAPIVYYGWCGTYYGPWYYGSAGVVVFGAPHGWHGHFRVEPPHNFAPHPHHR